VAVADFFDATVHDRVYRKAWPMDQVLAAIAAMSGSAFDPAVAQLCSRTEVQEAMVVTSRPVPSPHLTQPALEPPGTPAIAPGVAFAGGRWPKGLLDFSEPTASGLPIR